MTEASLPAQALSAEARRKEVEQGFGERLRSWIGSTKLVTVERALGLKGNDLYDVLTSAKHARAAWLELLPPAVELAYLAERAAAHALRLAPVATEESTMGDIIAHVGHVLTLCAQSEQDGWVSPEEATADLKALRALARKLEEVIGHRERAIRERGAPVVKLGRR